MRKTLTALAATVTLGGSLLIAAPAQASTEDLQVRERSLAGASTASPQQSSTLEHLGVHPGQTGISGCFLQTAPLFVTSGLNSLQVWDVSKPESPALKGVLPNVLFENEAMTCGERKTKAGTQRFALVGVDLVNVAPGEPQHTNIGGGEVLVVDVTNPAAPTIRSRVEGTTSTHTVACVQPVDCTYAYSAGDRVPGFSVFDLRNLDAPKEVDSSSTKAGVQPFPSPTAGHKWNFDAAGIGTHTGWGGASMWDTSRPARPRLITTTGLAGQGGDPKYAGWNDFILHNSFRPNANAFRPMAAPSVSNGNVLLVTEEDYEETDCAKAGSFQTWWVKKLDGTKNAIVPLDKVELADLGTFPLPHGGFCSSHWFDFRPGGLVAVGFYGGGTQVLDIRNAKDIKSYGHSVWGGSEVWDAMWVPVYKDGKQTAGRTNIVYSIDLVRGLDVYRVRLPGTSRRTAATSSSTTDAASVVPMGMVGGALLLSLGLGRITRKRRT